MPKYSDFQTAVAVILQIIGTVGVIAGAVAGIVTLVRKAKKPTEDLAGKVQQHDALLKKDNERLTEIETGQRLVLRSMMTLMDHELDGNSVDKLKKNREDINNYLIER